MAEAGDLEKAGGSETVPPHLRGKDKTRSDSAELRTESERAQLKRFFSNPMVGFVGTIASVIGVGLAVFFYLEGRATRELLYLVNPARTVVVHAGQTSRLSITLDGAPITRDVTSAQIAFWNEGHASIKADNMLQTLVIRTPKSAPIIDAVIRKVHRRRVVDVDIDRHRMAQGELAVHWNILEFQDGGVIQITYIGGVDTSITAVATIEGQGDLAEQKPTKIPLLLAMIMALTPGLIALITKFMPNTARRRYEGVLLVLFILFSIYGVISVTILLRSMLLPTGPSFGF
ncbi:MAG TPA: hypothetical protein VFE33_21515 [Thermoanaerobaculia bacterium]|nr:hypothetical protein [Thermoanaerobaculia bacterium]